MILDDRDWELLQTVWDYLLIDDVMPSKADAIIVGGSGRMTDGALRAAELYCDGASERIVVSGYRHPRLNVGQTEADLLTSVLVNQGVPRLL